MKLYEATIEITLYIAADNEESARKYLLGYFREEVSPGTIHEDEFDVHEITDPAWVPNDAGLFYNEYGKDIERKDIFPDYPNYPLPGV